MESATAPPRYTARPLPPYRHIPGITPHPERDPAGYAFGTPRYRVKRFKPADWRGCDAYLYGIDLFNHGYWWEAHAALEEVWVALGRRSRAGRFVQGLILLAASQLKRSQGSAQTAAEMASEGLEKMAGVNGVFLGIDTTAFRRQVADYLSADDPPPLTIGLIAM